MKYLKKQRMYPGTLKHPAHNVNACKELPCCHLELSPDTTVSPKMGYPFRLLCGFKRPVIQGFTKNTAVKPLQASVTGPFIISFKFSCKQCIDCHVVFSLTHGRKKGNINLTLALIEKSQGYCFIYMFSKLIMQAYLCII